MDMEYAFYGVMGGFGQEGTGDGGVGVVFCFVFVLVIIHHIIFNWHAFYIQELQGSIKAWME
jgi:hypothetical protein